MPHLGCLLAFVRGNDAEVSILDASRFPFANRDAQKLHRLLAERYRNEDDAFGFVETLGLKTLNIPSGKAPAALWRLFLEAAATAGLTRTIVEATNAAYPKNPDAPFLQRLLARHTAEESGNEVDIDIDRYLRAVERDLEYLPSDHRLVDVFVAPRLASRGRHSVLEWPNLDWKRPTAIVGPAGVGKSTLLRHLTLINAAACREAGTELGKLRDKGARVPILVDLRELAVLDLDRIGENLSTAISDLLPEDRIRELMSNGDAMLIFDKLDEIADDDDRRRIAASVRRPGGGRTRSSSPRAIARGRAGSAKDSFTSPSSASMKTRSSLSSRNGWRAMRSLSLEFGLRCERHLSSARLLERHSFSRC
jgi:hypothetical protein